jgi:hypothetical protein
VLLVLLVMSRFWQVLLFTAAILLFVLTRARRPQKSILAVQSLWLLEVVQSVALFLYLQVRVQAVAGDQLRSSLGQELRAAETCFLHPQMVRAAAVRFRLVVAMLRLEKVALYRSAVATLLAVLAAT